MEDQSGQEKRSPVLLIDHLKACGHRTLTRFRSTLRLDGKMVEKVLSLPFHKYTLQNSCNNLLCFVNHDMAENPVYLVDLVANKITMLPKPNPARCKAFNIYTYGVGFDYKSKVYKTVRIELIPNSRNRSNHCKCAQFNCQGDSSWELANRGLPSGSIYGKPVAVHGALVWADFPRIDAAMSSQRCAQAFDLCKNEFFRVRLPPKFKFGHLVELNGKLCAVDLSSDSFINILVSQNLDGSWESLCSIKIMAIQGERDHRMTRVIGSLWNTGKVLLKRGFGAYFTYEAATEKLEKVYLPIEAIETEVLCYNGNQLN